MDDKIKVWNKTESKKIEDNEDQGQNQGLNQGLNQDLNQDQNFLVRREKQVERRDN